MLFNRIKSATRADTLNLAGGEAFTETPKLELASMLLTCTLRDQFYRAADVSANHLRELIAQVGDKKFVAKAALYARNKAGMRSVSHLTAGELARNRSEAPPLPPTSSDSSSGDSSTVGRARRPPSVMRRPPIESAPIAIHGSTRPPTRTRPTARSSHATFLATWWFSP